MVGAGAVAAVSVIAAGLVRFPATADDLAAGGSQATAGEATAVAGKAAKDRKKRKASKRDTATEKRPVKYIRLKPGQKAPKGAKVIREAAPTPRIVVQRTAPSAQRSKSRVVTRTRQSG